MVYTHYEILPTCEKNEILTCSKTSEPLEPYAIRKKANKTDYILYDSICITSKKGKTVVTESRSLVAWMAKLREGNQLQREMQILSGGIEMFYVLTVKVVI